MTWRPSPPFHPQLSKEVHPRGGINFSTELDVRLSHSRTKGRGNARESVSEMENLGE